MKETTPLNGTTIKDEAWKEKKGFGPLIMVAILLLGLAAFYAGQMSGSSTVVTPRGGDGADASVMSYDAFESMESTTNSCYTCSKDNLCCCQISKNQMDIWCEHCWRCI